MSDEYTPPETWVGKVVIWHDGRDANSKGFAAIVTATGLNGIVDVLAFPSGSYGGLPKSGVRYHEDPDKRAINNTEDGVWSVTEGDTRRKALPPAKPR